MGIERSSLYHKYDKQRKRDEEAKKKLFDLHVKEPRYGVRRLAIDLGWSEEKTRRIRNLLGIKALRRTKSGYPVATHKDTTAPDNKLKQYWEFKDINDKAKGYTFASLTSPDLNIWAQDFTYIKWRGKFCYLAAALRLSSRKIVGWEFKVSHDANLVCGALEDALIKEEAPDIAHSDQGSEYLSFAFTKLCKDHDIITSASDAGEPWQNGFMESFFNTFKEEMSEKMKRAETITELYVMVANWIYYYNNKRIHTSLKMTPVAYEERLFHKRKRSKKKTMIKSRASPAYQLARTCPAL